MDIERCPGTRDLVKFPANRYRACTPPDSRTFQSDQWVTGGCTEFERGNSAEPTHRRKAWTPASVRSKCLFLLTKEQVNIDCAYGCDATPRSERFTGNIS